MKRSVTCALLAALLMHPCFAADKFIKAEHVTFAGLEMFAQVVKQTVACVQIEGNQTDKNKGNDWVSIGTAFLVNASNTVYAITCNHVIAKPLAQKKTVYIAIETDKEFRRAPCKVDFQDPGKDIAIVHPTKPTSDKTKIANMLYRPEDFADSSILIEGRALVIPGYPLGLGAALDDNHPVVRFGIIAQHTGKPFFLIDGVASHGNSGSPVYCLKERKLAGMVTSHVADHISLLDEKGQLAARLPYNSGLGRAVTGAELKAALEKVTSK